jgi:hypothetical protein
VGGVDVHSRRYLYATPQCPRHPIAWPYRYSHDMGAHPAADAAVMRSDLKGHSSHRVGCRKEGEEAHIHGSLWMSVIHAHSSSLFGRSWSTPNLSHNVRGIAILHSCRRGCRTWLMEAVPLPCLVVTGDRMGFTWVSHSMAPPNYRVGRSRTIGHS